MSFLRNHESYKNKALQKILYIANLNGNGPKTSRANYNTENLSLLFKNKPSKNKVRQLQNMTESQKFKVQMENKEKISEIMENNNVRLHSNLENNNNSFQADNDES